MPPTRPSPRRLPVSLQAAALLVSTLVTMAAATAPHACAAPPPSPATRAGEAVPDVALLRQWIEQSAATIWPGGRDAPAAEGSAGATSTAVPAMRVEVSVGRLDAGPRLAACARVEPFLPPNARLWGRILPRGCCEYAQRSPAR